jgi:predicted permease
MRTLRRMLRFNPTFAVAALLTLGLGIGANTAVFSVVNGVLLSPLPYPEPDRLVSILTRAPGAPSPDGGAGGIRDLPEPESMFATYADENRSFDSIGFWWQLATTVTGAGDPEQVRSVGVSAGVLETLNVQPLLGRWLSGSDYQPRLSGPVMISYGYWQRKFGGDPSILRRTITVESRPREIVGVMPPGFRVVHVEPEIIVPQAVDRSQLYLVPFTYQTVARLKAGVTIAEADADLRRLANVWLSAWTMPPGFGANSRGLESWRIVSSAEPLRDQVVGSIGNVLWVLMGTIGIVLLIACANVANLLLVRAEGRQQELAVRTALGAGWSRIVRELLTESVWLGLLGGALGLAVAYVGVRLLVRFGPATLPRLHEISISGPVLAFALLASLLSGLLFGAIPAFKYGGRRFAGALMGSRTATHGRERHRARNGLVVIQVALALVMLVSSGLMIRTFQAMRAVEPGFARPEQLQTLRIALPQSVAATPQRAAQMHKQIVEALAALPGVTSVALSTAMPMEGVLPNPILTSRSPLRAESDTDAVGATRPLRWSKSVSPGFFRTSGARLITGREFEWVDLEQLRPVAIVSENLAIEQWGSASAALGKRVRGAPGTQWRDVIGVVQDVRENGVHAAAPPIVYWPSMTESVFFPGGVDVPRSVAFVVRSPLAGTQGLIDGARRAVWSVNPNLPVALVRTMQEVYDQSMARTSFTLVMMAIAAAMALVLGIVGIYAVIAYAVAQRTREIGIRVALGAQQGELRRMFLRYGLVLASVGVAIGAAVAAALTRFMRSLLFEVSPLDPATYVAVSIALMGTALLASYLPARRASAIDPAVSLRSQ